MNGQIEDISLLFSSLVILPQDKEVMVEEKSEAAQPQASQTPAEEKEPAHFEASPADGCG